MENNRYATVKINLAYPWNGSRHQQQSWLLLQFQWQPDPCSCSGSIPEPLSMTSWWGRGTSSCWFLDRRTCLPYLKHRIRIRIRAANKYNNFQIFGTSFILLRQLGHILSALSEAHAICSVSSELFKKHTLICSLKSVKTNPPPKLMQPSLY